MNDNFVTENGAIKLEEYDLTTTLEICKEEY